MVKLEQGNQRLRKEFNSFALSSKHQDDSEDDGADVISNTITGYEPKIISPGHQTPVMSSTLMPSEKSKRKAFINLPDKHKRLSDEYEERNRPGNEHHRSPGDNHRSYDYRSYSSQKFNGGIRFEGHNDRYSTQRQNGDTSSSSYNRKFDVDEIMRRYSIERSNKQFETSSHHKRRGSLTDGICLYFMLTRNLFLKTAGRWLMT